jgi:bifunctional DNA-binding transcriptional regulator/antitoxin component of YhaV-PrlF toxin-antitoxin module
VGVDILASMCHNMAKVTYMIIYGTEATCVTEHLRITELRIGPQGRIVLPAALRHAWGVDAGTMLVARLEDERLVLEKPAQVVQRVKARFAVLRGHPSLADELIADRRVEANQEAGE